MYLSIGRITDLDTLLAVLEAKLNSIPLDTTTTTNVTVATAVSATTTTALTEATSASLPGS